MSPDLEKVFEGFLSDPEVQLDLDQASSGWFDAGIGWGAWKGMWRPSERLEASMRLDQASQAAALGRAWAGGASWSMSPRPWLASLSLASRYAACARRRAVKALALLGAFGGFEDPEPCAIAACHWSARAFCLFAAPSAGFPLDTSLRFVEGSPFPGQIAKARLAMGGEILASGVDFAAVAGFCRWGEWLSVALEQGERELDALASLQSMRPLRPAGSFGSLASLGEAVLLDREAAAAGLASCAGASFRL